MAKLNDVAVQVANNYSHARGEAAFDPAMIPVIIDVVMSLISMFKDCKKTPAQAVSAMKSPNLWERVLVNSAVRQRVGWRNFRGEGTDLVNAVLKTGSKAVEADVAALYDEVD